MGWLKTVNSSTGLSNGDKGDITVASSGASLSIDNNAVTYAKIQDMTTNRLLGRTTASTGDIEEISLAGLLSMSSGVLTDGITRIFLNNDVSDTTGSLVDSGLAFTPAASKIYEVTAVLVVDAAAATTGFQYQFTDATGGGGLTWAAQRLAAAGSATAEAIRCGAFGSVVASNASIGTTKALAIGRAMVKASGTVSGTVKIQFQTEVPTSAVTIYAGSFLEYKVIS